MFPKLLSTAGKITSFTCGKSNDDCFVSFFFFITKKMSVALGHNLTTIVNITSDILFNVNVTLTAPYAYCMN